MRRLMPGWADSVFLESKEIYHYDIMLSRDLYRTPVLIFIFINDMRVFCLVTIKTTQYIGY